MKLTTFLLLMSLLLSVGINLYLLDRFVINPPAETGVGHASPTGSADNDPFPLLSHWFARQQFDRASHGLAALAEDAPADAARLRQRWQRQARQWLHKGQYSLVSKLLTPMIRQHPDELSWQLLRADLMAADGDPLLAMEAYYQLLNQISDRVLEGQIEDKAHKLANGQLAELAQQQRWRGIIDFAEPLLAYESDHMPYLLALAQAYLQLNDLERAQQWLAQADLDPAYQRQAQLLQQQVLQAQRTETSIQLEPAGEHYLIAATLNEQHDVNLLIDTGASTSVLSQAKFDELQAWQEAEFISEQEIFTAGGIVNAPIYRFSQFQIDDIQVADLYFVILDLPDRRSDGLLGMNFLKQFRFHIDQQNARLELSPRRPADNP